MTRRRPDSRFRSLAAVVAHADELAEEVRRRKPPHLAEYLCPACGHHGWLICQCTDTGVWLDIARDPRA